MFNHRHDLHNMLINFSANLLRKLIPSPRIGLPLELFYFVSSITPLVNVDLLIQTSDQGRRKTLLTWREDNFYTGWHLPGGIVRFKEELHQRIRYVAENELSALVSKIGPMLEINEKFHESRDVRGHFISLLFLVELERQIEIFDNYSIETLPNIGDCRWHEQAPKDLIPQHHIYLKRF